MATNDIPSITALKALDQEIDENESAALRARWEFGQLMLKAREGKRQLPKGYLDALVERTGKSRSELQYRQQFAKKYPTETELSNALDSFKSWRDVIESLGKGKESGPPYRKLITLAQKMEKEAATLRGLLDSRQVEPGELDRIHDVAVAIVYEMDAIVEEIEEMEVAQS